MSAAAPPAARATAGTPVRPTVDAGPTDPE